MKKNKGTLKPIPDTLTRKENEYMKISNIESDKNESVKRKCQIRLSTTDISGSNSCDTNCRNYYNRYLNMKQEFNDGIHSHFMLQKDCHTKREIASLTKIMTCYTVLMLCNKYGLNKMSELITISKEATLVTGTTSNLKENDVLSVWDLLHALMLPSGNDAAHALAFHFGNLLLKHSTCTAKRMFVKRQSQRCLFVSHTKSNLSNDFNLYCMPSLNYEQDDRKLNKLEDARPSYSSAKEANLEFDPLKGAMSPLVSLSMFESSPEIMKFINEMNKNAKLLGMENTNFDSPHGLVNKNNKSTAYDMARLCMQCVKMKDFNLITKCRVYLCNNKRNKGSLISSLKSNKTTKIDYKWKNTNKLLSKGYCGIKTGVTPTAGPCLAAFISKKKRSYLGNNLYARWVEVMKAVEHCQREIQLSNLRGDVPLSTKQVYPLNQFNQKKSFADFKKTQSNNVTLNLDKTKYSDVEVRSESQYFPSIDTRDVY